MELRACSLVAIAALLLSSQTIAAEPARMSGDMLVGNNGMSLYTFDKDVANSGRSECNGPCATNWPPLLAQNNDFPLGSWSLVQRDDGRKQWAYRGKPLYFWSRDQKPGDISGDGFNGVWHIAR